MYIVFYKQLRSLMQSIRMAYLLDRSNLNVK